MYKRTNTTYQLDPSLALLLTSPAYSLNFSHVQAVIIDPHVSGLTGNQWALTLKFLYDEILCKLTASLGLYCKQGGETGGAGRERIGQ